MGVQDTDPDSEGGEREQLQKGEEEGDYQKGAKPKGWVVGRGEGGEKNHKLRKRRGKSERFRNTKPTFENPYERLWKL